MYSDIEVILRKYSEYLKTLIENNSNEMFSNAGLNHASILMSTLFDNTQKEARLFCEGFKPDLITTEPYYTSLKNYLADKNKNLSVLVETDKYLNEEPFCLLKEVKEKRGDDSISYRLIRKEHKEQIFAELNTVHCNFSVFDNNKFRLEFLPEEYKALGSFNLPDKCEKLIKLFDKAFDEAEVLN